MNTLTGEIFDGKEDPFIRYQVRGMGFYRVQGARRKFQGEGYRGSGRYATKERQTATYLTSKILSAHIAEYHRFRNMPHQWQNPVLP